ncbi:MAG TPA: hypothetical protein ENK30_02380, partial [Anaerolineae bacterium]|nr:hypothetical protein [Anaerolineae bacterium]
VSPHQTSRFGMVTTDVDNRIIRFEEKPRRTRATLASMGIGPWPMRSNGIKPWWASSPPARSSACSSPCCAPRRPIPRWWRWMSGASTPSACFPGIWGEPTTWPGTWPDAWAARPSSPPPATFRAYPPRNCWAGNGAGSWPA